MGTVKQRTPFEVAAGALHKQSEPLAVAKFLVLSEVARVLQLCPVFMCSMRFLNVFTTAIVLSLDCSLVRLGMMPGARLTQIRFH